MNFILQLSLILILIMTQSSPALANDQLTIITEEWPPYNYMENSELKGLSTEIVRLILNDLNIKAKPIVLPGPRAMKVFNTTPNSFFYSFIKTKERKPLYKWIGPFGEQSIYFYKKKGKNLSINSLEDAKKVKSICSRSSGLVFNMLTKAGFKNLDTGVSAEGLYLRAINERCDLVIGETPLGVKFWLNKTKQSPDALEQTKVKLISSPLYIIASKDVPDSEVAKWQKSLDKIKASNEYQQILQKYNH